MKKYCVTIALYGYVFIKADSESAAKEIVNDLKTKEVNWSDDWIVTDISEDETIPDGLGYGGTV